MQESLHKISVWCKKWKLATSPEKSSLINFFRKRSTIPPLLKICNKPIPEVKSLKILGIILDPNITWKNHINYLSQKGLKYLNAIKALSSPKIGTRSDNLLNIINATIRSIFDYGSQLFPFSSNSNRQKLEPIYNAALRLALGFPRNTPLDLLRAESVNGRGPVLEYGSQIYFSASRTNLAKLDRVQSSAARIITGMRHSCPTDLVLFEADIMPLDLRRKLLLSKSELIAIDEALRIIKTMTSPDEIWILCDSRSAIQHLSDWTNVGDKTSVSIHKNLKELSQQHEIYFQWIPSHIGLFGNDTADLLAKEGVTENLMQAPGGALSIKADRVVQTTISRLASGHIRGLSFNLGQKIYENCTKCNLVQATPDHLLFCAGLEREDIYSSPLLVYDFLRTLGLMDLV
ncbi:RNase H domain-containing protein [Trichonephila clavipes]|nr:RNase H domain-containing protein [Trichonephila clavipes]